MPLSRFRVGFCLTLLCAALSVRADDAVGVLRVDVASNETVAVAVPFEPLAAAGCVSDFLAGGFAGDGGEGSDRLWQVSSRDGSVSQSVFADGAWADAADGSPSAARASAGDALVFRPGPTEATLPCAPCQ